MVYGIPILIFYDNLIYDKIIGLFICPPAVSFVMRRVRLRWATLPSKYSICNILAYSMQIVDI